MRRFLLWLVIVFVLAAILPPLGARVLGWGPDEAARAARGSSVSIAGGLELNVVERGQGLPVVLVHGLPSCAADWGDTPARLAAAGYRAIAYDRVGYGYSSRSKASPDRYTYDSNARDLLALLDALEIDQAVLVGWSYGGGVVQQLARMAPERVSHLVLIGAVGPALAEQATDPLDVVVSSPVGGAVLAWAASVPPLIRAITDALLLQAFATEAAIPDGWAEYTRAMLALPGTLRTFALETRRNDLGVLRPEAIETATLVLHGTADHLVPVAVGEDLNRRLPRSELVLVPEGSHMLPVTHPDLIAERIDRLLRD